jgi:hypothetical protein
MRALSIVVAPIIRSGLWSRWRSGTGRRRPAPVRSVKAVRRRERPQHASQKVQAGDMFVMAAGSVGYHSAMSENVASVLAEAGDRPQCSGRYGALHISTPHDTSTKQQDCRCSLSCLSSLSAPPYRSSDPRRTAAASVSPEAHICSRATATIRPAPPASKLASRDSQKNKRHTLLCNTVTMAVAL